MHFSDQINEIINNKNISTFFQPIIHLKTGRIKGFEALSRGPEGSLYSPNNLFAAANRCHKLQEVELVCLEMAVETSKRLPSGYIFFNLSPKTVQLRSTKILDILGILKNRSVIELTEIRVEKKAVGSLVCILEKMRKQGIKIAIDDIGKGDRDFWSISELPSDFFKINQTAINGLMRCKNGTARRYRITIEKLVEMGRLLGAEIIAEGVETADQLLIVKELGIELVQGHYYSKAMPVENWIRGLKNASRR